MESIFKPSKSEKRAIKLLKPKYVFVDYEGTLSEKPVKEGVVPILDLLFGDVFTDLKPNENLKRFLLKQDAKYIYVLGVVDTNREIQQKEKWLKKHFRFIKRTNYFFVSGEHTKVEIMNEFVKYKNIFKENVVLIDDKQSYLDAAQKEGYQVVNVNDIVE